MTTLISILIVIASIALILVVIVQKSKGGGLAASFSGANNIMGVRKATDGIEKATWYLITAVIVLSIAHSAFSDKAVNRTDELQKSVEQKASSAPIAPSLPNLGGADAPEAPGATTQPAAEAPAPSSEAPATTGEATTPAN